MLTARLRSAAWGRRSIRRCQEFFGWAVREQKELKLRAYPEIRIQVSPGRVRVADLAIVPLSEPYEDILTRPPLAVIEVLSPEDRINRYPARLNDYRAMGIPAIWVIDPEHRGAFDCTNGDWKPTEEFLIPGTGARIRISELWAELDALMQGS
jgi:Uma2 family endonuclease